MNWFALLKILHILSIVIWIGGMFFAYLVLRPSLLVLEPPQRLALHTQVFRRFFLVVWHAMPLTILTGLAMLFGYLGGMAHAPWPIHAMLTMGLAMGAIFLAIFFGPYRKFRDATEQAAKVAALDSIRKLIGLNLALGLATIVVAMLR
jgi:uncharacterized membrane protein